MSICCILFKDYAVQPKFSKTDCPSEGITPVLGRWNIFYWLRRTFCWGGVPVLLIVDEVCANGHDVPVWESCVLGMGLLCVWARSGSSAPSCHGMSVCKIIGTILPFLCRPEITSSPRHFFFIINQGSYLFCLIYFLSVSTKLCLAVGHFNSRFL